MAYRFEKIKCNGKKASQFFMFSIKFLADFFLHLRTKYSEPVVAVYFGTQELGYLNTELSRYKLLYEWISPSFP
jgi:hypothetical protein